MTNTNASVLRLVEQGDAAYKRRDYEAAERSYEQALGLAIRTGVETNYVYSCLVKVYKKHKRYKEAYEISLRAVPSTAGFRDCAICLRQLAKQAEKAQDVVLLRTTLEELYRLAVLAYLCYGTHDCQTGSRLYDRAIILCQRLDLRQIHATYETHGVLAEGGLLTDSDYRLFASVFGENCRAYSPHQDFFALTQEVNNEYINWLRHVFWQDSEFGDSPSWIRMREENIAGMVEMLRKSFPFTAHP